MRAGCYIRALFGKGEQAAASRQNVKVQLWMYFSVARDLDEATRHWTKLNGGRHWIQRIACNVVWRLSRGRRGSKRVSYTSFKIKTGEKRPLGPYMVSSSPRALLEQGA